MLQILVDIELADPDDFQKWLLLHEDGGTRLPDGTVDPARLRAIEAVISEFVPPAKGGDLTGRSAQGRRAGMAGRGQTKVGTTTRVGEECKDGSKRLPLSDEACRKRRKYSKTFVGGVQIAAGAPWRPAGGAKPWENCKVCGQRNVLSGIVNLCV